MTERKIKKSPIKSLKPFNSNLENEITKCKDLISEVSKKSYEILVQANECLNELNQNLKNDSGEVVEIQNDLPEKCRMILWTLRSKEIESNLNVSAKVSFQDTSKQLRQTLHDLGKNTGMERLLVKTLKDSILSIKEQFKQKEKKDEETQVNFEEGSSYYVEKMKEIESFYK